MLHPMRIRCGGLWFLSALFASVTLAGDDPSTVAPWAVNRPIVTVEKELYKKHARPREAALVSVKYVGPEFQLREVHSVQSISDVGDNITARWSGDNGRTWSEFVPVQPSNRVDYQGVTVWEGEGCSVFDPTAGVLVQMWLRQINVDGIYHNITYSRFSRDQGRTWSRPQQLRYEDGDPFDPQDPRKDTFLNHNEGYFGSNLLVRRDGTLVHCLAHANAPGDPKNNERPWRMGSVLFTGKWDSEQQDYDWTPGARVEISPEHSARGLMEPEVAELRDGRLLVVWRGSTKGWDGSVAKVPGRKFYSLSVDDGRTLSPPLEWKYDDGTSFYSPSSYHRMVRHRVSGKLYWLGNLSMTPPEGNSPRYPLVIAEVDEEKAALKKSTVTAIDDRRPGQGNIQFSNFSLLENRKTHELELHLTTYGQEPDRADWATADNYKYTLRLAELSSGNAPMFEQQVLFQSGDNGYHTYRIPALTVTKGGRVLAFCEARKNSGSDHGDLDLALRRSTDGGRTWSPIEIIADDGTHTVGNPCPVVDDKTGTIWLPFCRDNKRILVMKSTDEGQTWSEPVDITDQAMNSDWHWVGTGPGHGIQLSSGRLLIPCWADATPTLGEVQLSYVFYSDDAGASWKLGGSLDANASDECEVVELSDGTLYMNARSRQGKRQRAYATSNDGGETWSAVRFDARLPEPSCQGSIVRITDPRRSDKSRILLATPANPSSRSQMTVRLSYDDAGSWPVARVVDPGSAAYSDLAVSRDLHALLLYESDAYRTITLTRFNLRWLTEGEGAAGANP